MTNIKNNELWAEANEMAKVYTTKTDGWERELIFEDILETLKGYMKKVIANATNRAIMNGVQIPREDFESRVLQSLWKALNDYDVEGKSSFEHIAKRRFKLAEADVWRMYKRVGDANDKDGISYGSARWISLDQKSGSEDGSKSLMETVTGNTQSAEEEYMDAEIVNDLLSGFAKQNERYANVIRYMAMGYKGDELAQITGESNEYDSRMRKLTQRAKDSFAKYMSI